MLEKIIYFLKRIFNFNSVKSLPAFDFAGNSGNLGTGKNINLVTVENNNSDNTNDNKIEKNESIQENQEKDLSNVDLVSYALDQEESKEESENQFQYDINKVQEMNEKIDYYKKDTDKLYSLSLAEILEINFYYQKRIENLKNSNN